MINCYFSTAQPFYREELAERTHLKAHQLDFFLRFHYGKTFRQMKFESMKKMIQVKKLSMAKATKLFAYSRKENLIRALKNDDFNGH